MSHRILHGAGRRTPEQRGTGANPACGCGVRDIRSASSWRAVRATRDQLRQEAELRVPPDVKLGVVQMCFVLMAFIGAG